MFFTKYPHRANFSFVESFDCNSGQIKAGVRCFQSRLDAYEGDIYRLRIENDETWGPNKGLSELTPPSPSKGNLLQITSKFGIEILNEGGKEFIAGPEGESFGVSGDAWMFRFRVGHDARFYGMGEKTYGRLELSGVRTKFYNTDVWGDFHWGQVVDAPTDPPYLSVPYLIIKKGKEFLGLLLNTPYPAFMETPGIEKGRAFAEWRNTSPELIIGAEGGQPDLWIINGPSLKELTQKLQKLVGVTPLPPTWSLGYHQCKWGYAGETDLLDLDKNFTKHDIPCDGVWLDIDYMRGYRVFTVDAKHFPDGVLATAEKLKAQERKIVAILDPGVKFEKAFDVYADGHKKNIFCLNTEGKEFVGMVWPGETVFPDFTLKSGRDWWASYVADFAKSGFAGSWLDMNDPSTGPVDPSGMLFNEGREPHNQHRNQYALGMQMASRDGFLQARPNERPFLLSRSGSTGSSRYSAIWTGDNFSSYFYLKMAIPTSVNLSLSGIPFNGPDVGGFGGIPTEQLMTDWMKACFLFPFCRNHNGRGDSGQEPWMFSTEGTSVVRKFIRLRYKLVPYLYNLFIDQEEMAEPLLRPLMYEFPDDKRKALEFNSDQFMVGASVLQAPVISRSRKRTVLLPGSTNWLDASNGTWLPSGTMKVQPDVDSTPFYLRNGAVLPMQRVIDGNKKDLLNIEILIAADPATAGEATYTYRADDGISFDYRKGKRSAIDVVAKWVDGNISVELKETSKGFGSIDVSILVPQGFKQATLNGASAAQKTKEIELTGKPFKVSQLT